MMPLTTTATTIVFDDELEVGVEGEGNVKLLAGMEGRGSVKLLAGKHLPGMHSTQTLSPLLDTDAKICGAFCTPGTMTILLLA